MTTLYNPLLTDLAIFEVMSDGEKRAAGRYARRQAAKDGYPNKVGQKIVTPPNGSKARLTMFSA